MALLGTVLSSLLAWQALTKDDILGCDDGSWFRCSAVLHSRFAEVLAIPVSLLGSLVFVTITTCLCVRSSPGTRRARVRDTVLIFSAASAGTAALWFIGLQVLYLHHGCIYCMFVHVCSLTLMVLVVGSPANRRGHSGPLVAGLIAMTLMAGLQWFSPEPSTFRVVPPQQLEDTLPVIEIEPVSPRRSYPNKRAGPAGRYTPACRFQRLEIR